MSLLRIATEARRSGDPTALFEAIPYAKWLGVGGSADDRGLLCALPFRQDLLGNPLLPALHGGVVSAYLEMVMALELIWRLESESVPKTVTFTVDYLRSARGQATFARASVTKLGRRASAVHAVAWQEDEAKPVAQAHGHFLVTGRPAREDAPST